MDDSKIIAWPQRENIRKAKEQIEMQFKKGCKKQKK